MRIRKIYLFGVMLILSTIYTAKNALCEVIKDKRTQTLEVKNSIFGTVSHDITIYAGGGIHVLRDPAISASTSLQLLNGGEIFSQSDNGIHLSTSASDASIINQSKIYGEKKGIFGEKNVNVKILNGIKGGNNEVNEQSIISGKDGAIWVHNLYLDNSGIIRNSSHRGDYPTIDVGYLTETPYFSGTNTIINRGSIINDRFGYAIAFGEGHNILELETGSKITGFIAGKGSDPRTKNELFLRGTGMLPTVQNFDTLYVHADNENGWLVKNAEIKKEIILFSGKTLVSKTLGSPTARILIMSGATLKSYDSSDSGMITGDVLNKGGTISASSGGLVINGHYNSEPDSRYSVNIYKNGYSLNSNDLLIVRDGGDFSNTSLQINLNDFSRFDLIQPQNTYQIVKGATRGFKDTIDMEYSFFEKPTLDANGQLTIAFKNKIAPFMISGLKSNERVMANLLSKFYFAMRDPFTPAEKIGIMNRLLVQLSKQATTLLNSGNAQIYGRVSENIWNTVENLTIVLHERGQFFNKRWVPWGGIFAENTIIKETNETDRNHENSLGMLFGLEHNYMDQKNQTGMVTSMRQAQIHSPRIDQSAHAQVIQIGLYHTYQPRAHIRLSGSTSYAYYWGTASRDGFLELKQEEKNSIGTHGHFSGHIFNVSAQVAFPFTQQIPYIPYIHIQEVELVPLIRLNAAFLQQNAVHEEKSLVRMHIAPHHQIYGTSLLGLKIQKVFLNTSTPIHVAFVGGWVHVLRKNKNQIKHTLPSFNLAAQPIEGYSTYPQRDQDTAMAQLSVHFKPWSNIDLHATALGSMGKTLFNQMIIMGGTISI